MSWIGLVVKSTVGQGTTEAFIKKQEQQGDLNALGGKPVGIAVAIAIQ